MTLRCGPFVVYGLLAALPVMAAPGQLVTNPSSVRPGSSALVTVVASQPLPPGVRFMLHGPAVMSAAPDRLSSTVTVLTVTTGATGLVLVDCQFGSDLIGRGFLQCIGVGVESSFALLRVTVGARHPEVALLDSMERHWRLLLTALLGEHENGSLGHTRSLLELTRNLRNHMARHAILSEGMALVLSQLEDFWAELLRLASGHLCRVVSLLPAGPEKVIMSRLQGDPHPYPSPLQSEDGRIRIEARVVPPLPGIPVHFWVRDPPDLSPYVPGVDGDNNDPTLPRGAMEEAPGYPGSGNVDDFTVRTDSQGKAVVILRVSQTFAGDNYIVKARCLIKLEPPEAETRPLIAWRREYIEIYDMYRFGALVSRIDFAAPHFRLFVHRLHNPNYQVAEAPVGSHVRVFDAYDQAGQRCRVTGVTRIDNEIVLTVLPVIEPGQAAPKSLRQYLPQLRDHLGRIGGSAAFVPEHRLHDRYFTDGEYLDLAFGGDVQGTDGGAFTEFKVLRRGVVPKVVRWGPAIGGAAARTAARNTFGWLWFDETRDRTSLPVFADSDALSRFLGRYLRVVHVVNCERTGEGTLAGITQSRFPSPPVVPGTEPEPIVYRRPVPGFPGTFVNIPGVLVCTTSYVAIFIAQNAAPATPAQRRSIARETLVHEVSHHWFPAGPADPRGEHSDEVNWRGPGSHCIMDNRGHVDPSDAIQVFGDGEAEFSVPDLVSGGRALRTNGRIR